MEKEKQKAGGIHYAWVVTAGCFLMSMAGTAILINCMGVFIKPVSGALGFSRGAFSLFYTFAALATTAVSPLMGRLLQRDSRGMVLLCSAGAAASLWGYSLCTRLWQFYLAGAVCGLFTAGLTSMSISTLINRWFTGKKGLATGIAFSGSGIGSMVLNPLASSLIEGAGWQTAFRCLALVLLAVNLPTAALLLRNSPGERGERPFGKPAEGGGLAKGSIPRQEALRMPPFWCLALAMFLAGAVGTGIQQHINAYLTDMGYGAAFAASVFSLVMAFLILGKLLLGWLFDTVGARAGSVLVCGLLSLSALLLLAAGVRGAPVVFGAVFGMAYAVLSVPPSFLTGELLGPADYGANYGVVNMFLCGGMALGSPVSAALFDATGSYRPAWLLYALLGPVILALLLAAIAGLGRRRELVAYDKEPLEKEEVKRNVQKF